MSYKLICQKCGFQNSLGKLFCTQCGAKLDLSESGVRNAWVGEGMRSVLPRLFRVFLSLLLLVCLGLLLWPAPPSGNAGTRADAQMLRGKLQALSDAAENHRALAMKISEAEVNGYLREMLESNKAADAAGGLQYKIKDVNTAFSANRLRVLIAAEIGVLTLTYEVEGRPELSAGFWQFRVDRVRMGRLPIPGALGRRMADRVLIVFSRLDREWALVNQLGYIRFIPGMVEVMTATQR